MDDDIRALLPKHKYDLANAGAIVSCGYPAVKPVLSDLMTWLRDYNWPVAHVLAPFLATIGSPVIPEVHRVLQTNDDVWKYWVLMCIVAESHEVAEALQEELTRLAESPTSGEVAEEVNVVAQEILHRLKGNEGASL